MNNILFFRTNVAFLDQATPRSHRPLFHATTLHEINGTVSAQADVMGRQKTPG